jgi:hypothetical protein
VRIKYDSYVKCISQWLTKNKYWETVTFLTISWQLITARIPAAMGILLSYIGNYALYYICKDQLETSCHVDFPKLPWMQFPSVTLGSLPWGKTIQVSRIVQVYRLDLTNEKCHDIWTILEWGLTLRATASGIG